jgi:hypothetical protein
MELIESRDKKSAESLWIINWVAATAGTQAKVLECSQCDRKLILVFSLSCLVLDNYSRGLHLQKKGKVSIVSHLENLTAFLLRVLEARDEDDPLDETIWSPVPVPVVCLPCLYSAPLRQLTRHVSGR